MIRKVVHDGRHCGDFDNEDKTYTTWRRPEHFCRKHNGWGIQQEVVDQLKELGCERVHINYTNAKGEKKHYHTPFQNYLDTTIAVEDVLNIQAGKQVFVNKRHFTDPNEKKKTPASPNPNSTLDMWEED